MNETRYDYFEAVKNDLLCYIDERADEREEMTREEFYEEIYDGAFISDSVTGNASGSYFCNTWESEEALCHNLDLLGEALTEFCCDGSYITERGAEACDVTVRCYVLGQVLGEALDEYDEEHGANYAA